MLLRHAKSDWPDVPDQDRPLAKRGRHDAPAVGRWLRDHGLWVPITLSRPLTWSLSPAVDLPRRAPGRPRTALAVRTLVLEMARDNPSWGYRRIHGELTGLGYKVALSTVWQILKDAGIDPAPRRAVQTWRAFLAGQAMTILPRPLDARIRRR
jgi:Homeodomain-like domain